MVSHNIPREKLNNQVRYHPHPRFLPYPSKFVSIRGIQEDIYTVLDVSNAQSNNGIILEELEWSRALFEVS
jgi:DEAD/DEAH box helicase domain-containing protein